MRLFNSVLAFVTRKRSPGARALGAMDTVAPRPQPARIATECYVCGGDVRHLCVRCRHRAR
jgi:hypothetical protein